MLAEGVCVLTGMAAVLAEGVCVLTGMAAGGGARSDVFAAGDVCGMTSHSSLHGTGKRRRQH